jgi:hypothetical protein
MKTLCLISFWLLFLNPKPQLSSAPCSQWLDACCIRLKCENQMNYVFGVDGYGASGYCHGVMSGVDIWAPGNWTYVCSPKRGLVVLTLFADKRCHVETHPSLEKCESPTPCP